MSARSRKARPPPAGTPLRALVVEHNDADVELAVHALERAGFAVTADVASTAEEFTARLRTGPYDVILADYRLPTWTGMDALATLHALGDDTPLILVTGTLGEERAVECIKQGVADYILKDQLTRLPVAVRRAIEEHHARADRARADDLIRKLTLAVEQSPASVFITDLNGAIEYVNRRFTEVTGYTAQEALGQTPRLLKSGRTAPETYVALWATLRRGEVWRAEVQNRRKSGELYWDAVAIAPIRDPSGTVTHFLSTQLDITEQKRAAEQIREREERFQQIAENIKEVFYVADAQYREMLYISPAYEEIWGRTCQSLYDHPQSFIDPVPPEDQARLFASIARIQQGEDPGELEFRVVRPDGQVRWILGHAVPVRNERGEVYRVSGVALDITQRKEAEAALRDSEGRLRMLFETVNLIVLGLDADGRVDYVNPFLLRLTGYTRDEAFGSNWFERFVPTRLHAEMTTAFRDLVAKDAHPHYQNPIVTKAGEERMISWHYIVVRDPHGRPTGTLSIGEDITEKARAEQIRTAVYRIAEASQRTTGLEELLKSVHEVIGTLMPAKNFYIALYDEANDLITFPYFVDEVDPPPPPRRPGRGMTEQVLRTGRPFLVRPDTDLGQHDLTAVESIGTPSVDWLGVPLKQGDRTIGVIAAQTYAAGWRYEERDKEILQFVSTQVAAAIERKRAEDALRDNEERFRALVEHSGDAIALLDRSGKILYASQSTTLVLGREVSQVIGTNAFDLLHPDDLPEVRHTLLTLRDEPGRPLVVRSRFRHADGTWRDGEGTITNRLHDPAVGALVFNYRDVTERTRLETQFRQAQKMEAVGRLAGGVAHDFNNLLTAIFGYADLLAEDLPPDHPGREDLQEIRSAATRASALTRQLLAFSRQQVLQPVVLNLNDVVENVGKMLLRLLGEDIDVHPSLAADLGNVRADAGQIEQVMMNLAVNARDAMPTGGKLTIETANVDLSAEYAREHAPVIPGRYVMLAMSDTGIGMDEAVKAKAFEPFFTTKEAAKGTGLGLATVYGIVKQSGGYVWLYSEPGKGATFKIYLPRVDAPREALVPAPELAGTVAGTETLLVAEDDPLLLPLARELLTKLGYRVLEARDAAEALAAARRHQGDIHLLVSDVVMPGGGGFQLAQQLLAERPGLRVLYMSGYTDEAVVRHGLLERGLNYLQKPFTPAILARRVREVLDAKP